MNETAGRIPLTWYQLGTVPLPNPSSPLVTLSSPLSRPWMMILRLLLLAIVAALPPPLAPSLASALATINVKNHIPFALELDAPNYSTWRELFQTLVGKFGASSHIDGTPVPENPDASRLEIDCSICSLIYSSSSPRVMRLIMETGASAHTIWTKAANLFLDNKDSRVMTLEAKFRALPG